MELLRELFPFILMGLILALLLWLLFPSRYSPNQGDDSNQPYLEHWDEPTEPSEGKKQQVREIIGESPELANQLNKLAGASHNPILLNGTDEEKIYEIAKKVPDDLIDMLHVAATQEEISIELNALTHRTPVNYPTRDIEPAGMTDMGQLSEILPEQQMMKGPQFYAALAQEELMILQSYEHIAQARQLYILEDISGSMDQKMGSGKRLARYIWAHGISLNLALQALNGEAVFARREFDGEPHHLIEVNSREEAEKLIDRVVRSTTSSGGTNIYAALKKAAEDIRSRGSGELGTDILLITDAEDTSINRTDLVRKLLGDDLRLHVVLIGVSTSPLSKVATTFRSFH